MTHYNNLIRQLKAFTPSSAKAKKAKKTVLSSLYAVERKEKPRPTKKRTKKAPAKSKPNNESFLHFVARHGASATAKGIQASKQAYATHKEKRAIQKSSPTPLIHGSHTSVTDRLLGRKNAQPLPPKTDLRVVHTETRPAISKDIPPKQVKKPTPFGGFKSAETPNTSEGV